MAPITWLERVLLSQRGHLFPWSPVMLALGISLYFSLPTEPSWLFFSFMLLIGFCGWFWAALKRGTFAPLGIGLVLFVLGFGLALLRAHIVAGPLVDWRYYGAVEGRIINMDRAASGALRLTLDRVRLDLLSQEDTPRRVRISLHGRAAEDTVTAGSTVLLTAHLSAPNGPVEPRGFDFQRHAWFMRLGAVGYSRSPVMLAESAGREKPIVQAKFAFAQNIRDQIGGEAGAFAAAIVTGDRSGMSQETVRNLRHTNLAHLLAISGLHMGLLSGFVFALIRYGLAVAPFRTRVPTRKVSAVVALAASFAYLLLSGGSVATERAFIMAMVALGAIFFERHVFSLRSVALAAMIVLLMRPEALLGPGFQMSFAATTALVAVFAFLREKAVPFGPRRLRPITTLFISSAVAGLATAPIAAAHFNQFAHYGLFANLAAVPLMGALVVPCAVLAILAYPFGLAPFGFWLMGLGVKWILGVAGYFASLEGARSMVAAPGPLVLPFLAVGFLWLVLWQGRMRLAGVLPAVAAFMLWVVAERPDVLVSADGKLIGAVSGEVRVLSRARGGAFVAKNWLENDGDTRSQEQAAEGWVEASKLFGIIHLARASDPVPMRCNEGQLVVSVEPLNLEGGCVVLDANRLATTGSVALMRRGGRLEMQTAREAAGRRLWTLEIDQ